MQVDSVDSQTEVASVSDGVEREPSVGDSVERELSSSNNRTELGEASDKSEEPETDEEYETWGGIERGAHLH